MPKRYCALIRIRLLIFLVPCTLPVTSLTSHIVYIPLSACVCGVFVLHVDAAITVQLSTGRLAITRYSVNANARTALRYAGPSLWRAGTQKFKDKRRTLTSDEQVQAMKVKYGGRSAHRQKSNPLEITETPRSKLPRVMLCPVFFGIKGFIANLRYDTQ